MYLPCTVYTMHCTVLYTYILNILHGMHQEGANAKSSSARTSILQQYLLFHLRRGCVFMCKTNIKYNHIMCINVCRQSIHLIFLLQCVCVCVYSIFSCIVRVVERRRMQYSIKIKELVRVHFLYKSISERNQNFQGNQNEKE